MVVVPAFAHADQSGNGDIVTLSRHTIDDPALSAPAVREMANQPVASDANADPDTDAPDHPLPSAEHEEENRPGQLLPHPGPLDEGVEAVVGETRFQP